MKKTLLYCICAGTLVSLCAPTAKAQGAIVVEESTVETDYVPCKTQYYTGKTDNWFLQLGAGVESPFVENEGATGNKHEITAAYNVAVGKWFSPYVGWRLSGYYGKMHWKNYGFNKAQYANANIDFMWDMFNSLGGVDANRTFSIVPFVGFGGTFTWDYDAHGTNVRHDNGALKRNSWTLPVSAGLQLRFRLCKYADFFMEGRASFYGDNFNNTAFGYPVDINVQAIAGLTFNFGGREYKAFNPCTDAAYIANLNGQVNALRGEVAATAAALAQAEAQLPCPEQPTFVQPTTTATVAAPLMSTVRFTINSAKISSEEMVNVFNVAQYLKENPSVNVTICGYADKDTGTATYNKELSQKRAQAVYDALSKTYGIDGKRMSIQAEGSAVQPYTTNNWNRIVIFVPNN